MSGGSVAVITGASRGLGAALAVALARDHHIVCVARTRAALEQTDDAIRAQGGSATLAPLDINHNHQIANLCQTIYERWGKINLFVHAAIHAPPLSPVVGCDRIEFIRTLSTNVTATVTLIAMLSPLLKSASDAVALFFDDPMGGKPFFAAYGASKAAQMAVVRSWQAETKNTAPPRVLVYTPHPMATAVRKRFYPSEAQTTLTSATKEAKNILSFLQQS